MLNKYCTVRPQFVLHTAEYESQADGLTREDMIAATEALQAMGNGYLVIFNGGKDAGASVAHKHLQIVPKAKHIDGLQMKPVSRSSKLARLEDIVAA